MSIQEKFWRTQGKQGNAWKYREIHDFSKDYIIHDQTIKNNFRNIKNLFMLRAIKPTKTNLSKKNCCINLSFLQ